MDGFLLVDKPLGVSSFGAVQQLNRQFLIQRSSKKIGHGGTLDPNASGLLVIAIGKATRFLRYFLGSNKAYEATIRLGMRTTSDDLEGEIVEELPYSHIQSQDISRVINGFLGKSMQVPPEYSAVHVNGKRAYELARKGDKVDLSPKEVTFHKIDILDNQLPTQPLLRLSVECSGGTYIRSLARDIGNALNVGGCLVQLRRTHACHFNVAQAHSLEYLLEQNGLESFLHPCEEAMSQFPSVTANYDKACRLLSGLPVNFNISSDGIYTIYFEGQMIAVLERKSGQNDYLRLHSLKDFKEIASSLV